MFALIRRVKRQKDAVTDGLIYSDMMTRTTMMTIRGSRMSTSIMQSYNYNLLVYDETCLQHCKLTYDPLFSEDERFWLYFDISLDMISPGFFCFDCFL